MEYPAKETKTECLQRMKEAGASSLAMRCFERVFTEFTSTATPLITDSEIEPLKEVESLEGLDNLKELTQRGIAALSSVAILKLNGGLGTSMGCVGPKSEIAVRSEYTFNDIVTRQIEAYSKKQGVTIPLIHMTSFNTHDVIVRKVSEQKSPHIFAISQNRFPKLFLETNRPANHAEEIKNWYPPGHGDVYAVLYESGLLQKLLDSGKEYLFLSNIDNLGATLDTAILGYLASNKLTFVMEVAERTLADSKGGHVAQSKKTGRLLLRERASAPTDENGKILGEFSNIEYYRDFNTNNLWIHLPTLKALLDQYKGVLPLPVIVNRNKLDPRDSNSPSVVQLECACGTALSLFEKSSVLRVPRSRFAPVKGSSDLLVVMSDAFVLNDSFELVSNPLRQYNTPPLVELSSHYAKFDDMIKCFRVIPSLVDAKRFVVSGDIGFPHKVKIKGEVLIENRGKTAKNIPQEIVELKDTNLKL